MPKLKSSRALRKRIKVSGQGKLRRYRAGKSHLLSSKSRKRKRRLRRSTMVSGADLHRLKSILG
jgi:large subunit ribosomal protein L35